MSQGIAAMLDEEYPNAERATCLTCGRDFPDVFPAARCPFEYEHEETTLSDLTFEGVPVLSETNNGNDGMVLVLEDGRVILSAYDRSWWHEMKADR